MKRKASSATPCGKPLLLHAYQKKSRFQLKPRCSEIESQDFFSLLPSDLSWLMVHFLLPLSVINLERTCSKFYNLFGFAGQAEQVAKFYTQILLTSFSFPPLSVEQGKGRGVWISGPASRANKLALIQTLLKVSPYHDSPIYLNLNFNSTHFSSSWKDYRGEKVLILLLDYNTQSKKADDAVRWLRRTVDPYKVHVGGLFHQLEHVFILCQHSLAHLKTLKPLLAQPGYVPGLEWRCQQYLLE